MYCQQAMGLLTSSKLYCLLRFSQASRKDAVYGLLSQRERARLWTCEKRTHAGHVMWDFIVGMHSNASRNLSGLGRRLVWAGCRHRERGPLRLTCTLHQQLVTVSTLVQCSHPQSFHPRHHIHAHLHLLLVWFDSAAPVGWSGFISSMGLDGTVHCWQG